MQQRYICLTGSQTCNSNNGEVTRAGGRQMAAPTGKGTPTDDHSSRPETLHGRQWKGGPRGRCCHDAARRVPSCPVARGAILPAEIRNKPRSPPKNVASTAPQNRSSRRPRLPEICEKGKRRKVREQCDLFVVAQRAQTGLCYHKKVGQKENL